MFYDNFKLPLQKNLAQQSRLFRNFNEENTEKIKNFCFSNCSILFISQPILTLYGFNESLQLILYGLIYGLKQVSDYESSKYESSSDESYLWKTSNRIF